MSIQIISISHKIAPIRIREKFSFTQEQQVDLIKRLVEYPEIDESLILSTCNRTELYVYTGSKDKRRDVFQIMVEELLKLAEAQDEEDIGGEETV